MSQIFAGFYEERRQELVRAGDIAQVGSGRRKVECVRLGNKWKDNPANPEGVSSELAKPTHTVI
jgi:hypothetical protein